MSTGKQVDQSTPKAPRPRGYTPSRTAPELSKQERRAAGKVAAAKRRAEAQRRRLFRQIAGVVVVLVALGAVAWLTGVFDSDEANPSANATPTPSASGFLPAGADPALATKPVVAPPSGTVTELKATTLIPGTGAALQTGQRITVNYVGVSFKTGQEFDTSWGSAPAQFTLASPGLIPGWVQGLPGVKIGSRVQLDIPAALAYGENPTDGSPGGALRFVVDVLGAS